LIIFAVLGWNPACRKADEVAVLRNRVVVENGPSAHEKNKNPHRGGLISERCTLVAKGLAEVHYRERPLFKALQKLGIP
jgi:hypothetical protein